MPMRDTLDQDFTDHKAKGQPVAAVAAATDDDDVKGHRFAFGHGSGSRCAFNRAIKVCG